MQLEHAIYFGLSDKQVIGMAEKKEIISAGVPQSTYIIHIASNISDITSKFIYRSRIFLAAFPAPQDATSTKTRSTIDSIFFADLIAKCGIIHHSALRRSGNFNYLGNKMRLMWR
jgi:hypothetical protein